MKIIVTGGAGFIGTNMFRFLKKKYPEAELISFDIAQPIYPVENVNYVHGDIRSSFHLEKIIKGSVKVFHFAAELGTHETFSNPDVTNETNIGGTVNLLELSTKHDFKLFLSSKPNVWLNPYSISKECAEKYAVMYHQEFETKVAILKFFSVYGPYQYVYKYQKAVPFFVYCALKNKPLTVYGNGDQQADFVYVEDVINAADTVLERNLFGEVIEFGTGKGTTVNDLAARIIKLTGSRSVIEHCQMRIGETQYSKIFANTDKAKKLLGIVAQTNLEKGLLATIDFYRRAIKNKQLC